MFFQRPFSVLSSSVQRWLSIRSSLKGKRTFVTATVHVFADGAAVNVGVHSEDAKQL